MDWKNDPLRDDQKNYIPIDFKIDPVFIYRLEQEMIKQWDKVIIDKKFEFK